MVVQSLSKLKVNHDCATTANLLHFHLSDLLAHAGDFSFEDLVIEDEFVFVDGLVLESIDALLHSPKLLFVCFLSLFAVVHFLYQTLFITRRRLRSCLPATPQKLPQT